MLENEVPPTSTPPAATEAVDRFIRVACLVLGIGTIVVFTGTWLRIPALDLRWESRIGSWLSSMLLLSVAVTMAVAFWRDGSGGGLSRSRLRFGWLVMAGMFVLLSADEMGSLHERLAGPVNRALGTDATWAIVLAGPILFCAVFMTVFGWLRLRSNPRGLLLLVLGVAAFLSVPVQEHVEVGMLEAARAEGRPFHRPLWLSLMEEGAELLGAWLFLGAGIVYIRNAGIAVGRWTRREAGPAAAPLLTLSILAASMLLIALWGGGRLLFAAAPEPSRIMGNPLQWPPSAAAFLAAVVCTAVAARRNLSTPATGDGIAASAPARVLALAACAVLSLALSLNHGTNRWFSEVFWQFSPRARLATDVLCGASFVLCGIFVVLVARPGTARAAGILTWSCLAAAALLHDALSAPLTIIASGLLAASVSPAPSRGRSG